LDYQARSVAEHASGPNRNATPLQGQVVKFIYVTRDELLALEATAGATLLKADRDAE